MDHVTFEMLTCVSFQPVEKMDEEELSELQLRLLALQSASKKWQQKEQQVMKRSKDRIIKASQDKASGSASGSVAAPADRPQKVTTRSASSAAAAAAAAAADRSRSRSKPADRDRSRPADRDRTKQSPKPGPRVLPDRARTPASLRSTKNLISQGEMVTSCRWGEGAELAWKFSLFIKLSEPEPKLLGT